MASFVCLKRAVLEGLGWILSTSFCYEAQRKGDQRGRGDHPPSRIQLRIARSGFTICHRATADSYCKARFLLGSLTVT